MTGYVFSFLQQAVDVIWLGGGEAINVQRIQLAVVLTGNLTQCFQRVIQIVARGDFVS